MTLSISAHIHNVNLMLQHRGFLDIICTGLPPHCPSQAPCRVAHLPNRFPDYGTTQLITVPRRRHPRGSASLFPCVQHSPNFHARCGDPTTKAIYGQTGSFTEYYPVRISISYLAIASRWEVDFLSLR